jgi:branched-chain amino acid transport system permease protein
MTRNLKQALFSALLVWAVAYPVLGLKLTIVGINLEVHNTSPMPFWRPSPSARC